MKKALSSVFKGKSSVGKKFDEEPNDDGLNGKHSSSVKESLIIDNLSDNRVHSLPPTPVTKMKSSNNAISNLEKSEKFQRQVSSNSSTSHSVHQFSSQDSLKERPINEFSQLKNVRDIDGKFNFKSSISTNIGDRMNYRLRSIDRESPIELISSNSQANEENEGIVTTPASPTTCPTSPSFKKFEHRTATSAAKEMFIADGFKAEKSKESNHEMSKMQSNEANYEELSSRSAMKAKMEANGVTASKLSTRHQDAKQLQTQDKFHQQIASSKATAMTLNSENMTSEKKSYEAQNEEKLVSQGLVHNEKNIMSTSSSKFVSKSSTISSSTTSSNFHYVSGDPLNTGEPIIEEPLSPEVTSMLQDVDMDFNILSLRGEDERRGKPEKTAIISSVTKIKTKMSKLVQKLKNATKEESLDVLKAMNCVSRRAWNVPNCGFELGFALCDVLRNSGAIDILLQNCGKDTDTETQLLSAQLLEQNLSTENRTYVVDKGLTDVVEVACDFSCNKNSVQYERIGTGLLDHLFKHSEETCKEMIKMGALKAILYKCRTTDVETLRHCASALSNLALFGGAENQQLMINEKAPMWLFPLAFHNDDNVKYYACLATAALVANKEIEAQVLTTGTLDLLEPFVLSHNPQEFAANSSNKIHGNSKTWLLKLVPVLDSDREEAKCLAAFHFAVEAWIRKKQGTTSVFHEIGAVAALKKVASSPNAIASKFAAQALKFIGEEVPHKLSQQVPLWTVDDVKEWVKQIGFAQYCHEFVTSRVDGDLLLQLNEEMLKDDINIKNGILRKRFMRELGHLKRIADYSSCDSSNLYTLLHSLGPVYAEYTYTMLQSGVDPETLKMISEEQLSQECKIENSIHRIKISQAIQCINQACPEQEEDSNGKKSLDVFISYRRSNGSQLASLLKVHLQLRGFSVFIDVERLEAGKFDSSLLNSIKQAKHFILVLTPSALDRCVGDNDCKDWVHKEIVEALEGKCDIIPILDSFQWPEPETLPADMRAVCYFNGVRWIHEYQDACVDKLERFLRGEVNSRLEGPANKLMTIGGVPGTPGTPTKAIGYPRKDSTQGSQDLLHHI